MNRLRCLLPCLCLIASTATALEVENVRVAQRLDTKLVDIDYDLADAAGPVTIGLEVSADGGATWTVPVLTVSGAYGPGVAAAADLRMTWDAGADWPGLLSERVRFRVSADAKSGEFVIVPGGDFEMGDHLDGNANAPVHTVAASSYVIGRHEVLFETWTEVRTWAADQGYTDLPAGASRGNGYPIGSISWLDAVKWCNARSEKEGLTPVYYLEATHENVVRSGDYDPATTWIKWDADGYRLPTEAEWEKAARGGAAGNRFPWGNVISHTEANFNNGGGETYSTGTTGRHPIFGAVSPPRSNPVAYFPANGYGLHGTTDNVWEWCHDRYVAGYYASSPEIDPRGPDTGGNRSLRGGSWEHFAGDCRINFRRFNTRSYSRTWGGLRLASSSLTGALLVSAESAHAVVDTRDSTLLVENVRAAQRPGTKLVDIDYDLTGPGPVTVGLEISADGGVTWTVPALHVSGAYGAGVAAGADLRMTWDAGADWAEQTSAQMRFRVRADEKSAEFVMIPGSQFEMGDHLDSETGAAVHEVTLSPFAIARHEVLFETWTAVREWAATHGYTDLPAGVSRGAGYPVASVAWLDVVKWCNARSEMEGLTPVYYHDSAHETVVREGDYHPVASQVKWDANGYRLPTEAEWEKAARGGQEGLRFPWGNSISHSQANFNNSGGESYAEGTTGRHPVFGAVSPPCTNPVESFAANGYGLHGAADNVWEWCYDRHLADYYASSPALNPLGPDTGNNRCLRGGSWEHHGSNCRINFRRHNNRTYAQYWGGFRLARTSLASALLASAHSADVALDSRDPLLVVEQPAGTALLTAVSVTDFLAAEIGGDMQARLFTLRNDGGLPLENIAATVGGAHSEDFTVVSVDVPTTLAAGASTSILVAFSPSQLGQRHATLQIASNDPKGTFTVGLTGQGGFIPVSFHWSNLLQLYDGTARPVTVVADPPDVPFSLTYSGAAEPPVLPGVYQVTAVVTSPLHKGSATVQLVVDHRVDRMVIVPEDEAEKLPSEETAWDTEAVGLYDGLLHDEADPEVLLGALETLKVTRTGAVTGKLRLRGRTIALKGSFDEEGRWELNLVQADKTVIAGALSLTRTQAGDEIVTGALTWDDLEATVYAPRVQAVADWIGTHTLLLPANPESGAAAPGGDGWALFKVNPAGTVTVTGRLSDGAAITETAYLSATGEWSFFAEMYPAGALRGRIGGRLVFRDVAGVSDADGRLHWVKPPNPAAKLFPEGFDEQIRAVGSRLTPPGAGERLLAELADAEPNASLSLISPALTPGVAGEVERVISWLPNNTLRHYGPEHLSGAANRASGHITGAYRDPDTATRLTFTGVVLQKQGLAGGHFLHGGGSGALRIKPGTEFPHPGSEGAPEDLLPVATPESLPAGPELEALVFERAAAGLYAGVIALDDTLTGGIENLRLNANGSFTGTVWIQGFRYALKGAFDLNGTAEVRIPRPGGLTAIMVTLQLRKVIGSADAYHLTGSLTLSGVDHQVDTQRLPPYTATLRAPQEGAWTLAVLAPEDTDSSLVPAGDGCAALTVSHLGLCTGALLLADGSKLTLAGHVSRHGEWSFHRGLYGTPARGFLAGKLTFRTVADVSDVDGEWRWQKQNGATPKSALYPAGFAVTRVVIGSRYQPPLPNERAWLALADDWHNVWLRLHGPAFADDAATVAVDRVMTWTSGNQVLYQGPDKLTVKFVPATGWLTGSFRAAGTAGKAQTFSGVLLQKQGLATGAYVTRNRSGRFVMEPR